MWIPDGSIIEITRAGTVYTVRAGTVYTVSAGRCTCQLCSGYSPITRSSWDLVYASPWTDYAGTPLRVVPEDRSFDWFRDFERRPREAVPVPTPQLAGRIWRRLSGAVASQVRRWKRRRFIQSLEV